jgi:hypothetical protein
MNRPLYYRWFLTPLTVTLIILTILQTDFFKLLFFSVAYCWHMALTVPGMRQKVENKSYRFSIVKLIFQWNDVGEKIFNTSQSKILTGLLRACGPLFFLLAICLLAQTQITTIFYGLLGSFIFEIVFLIYQLLHRDEAPPPDSEIPAN